MKYMKPKEEEPIIVAMRGREPQVLTPKRTEFGKAVRKQYENKELKMSRHTMQQLEPRKDGVTNTLTSVQKDYLVAEPQRVGNIYPSQGQNGDVYNVEGISPTISAGQGVNGRGIGSCNAPKITEPMCSVHPISHKAEIENGAGIKPIVPALRATDHKAPHCVYMPEATAQGYAEAYEGEKEMRYRIRKLTPRECFRLMGVDDKAIDTIQGAGISNSQMYKMAGNSIVVDTLYYLMKNMFCETENEQQQMTLF